MAPRPPPIPSSSSQIKFKWFKAPAASTSASRYPIPPYQGLKRSKARVHWQSPLVTGYSIDESDSSESPNIPRQCPSPTLSYLDEEDGPKVTNFEDIAKADSSLAGKDLSPHVRKEVGTREMSSTRAMPGNIFKKNRGSTKVQEARLSRTNSLPSILPSFRSKRKAKAQKAETLQPPHSSRKCPPAGASESGPMQTPISVKISTLVQALQNEDVAERFTVYMGRFDDRIKKYLAMTQELQALDAELEGLE